MNRKRFLLAVALLAAPLLATTVQPALAVAVTGNFSVAISGASIGTDTLSTKTGGGSGISNFSETLSADQKSISGSFSEALSVGSSYGLVEFFAINIPSPGGGGGTLTISFTGLSDGTSETSCTDLGAGSCVYQTAFTSAGWPDGTLTANFTDGNSLTILLQDSGCFGCTTNVVPGEITLTLNGSTPVPEPGSLALLGAALFGLGAFGRRKRA